MGDADNAKKAENLYHAVASASKRKDPGYIQFMTYALEKGDESLIKDIVHKQDQFITKEAIIGLLEGKTNWVDKMAAREQLQNKSHTKQHP